MEYINLLNPQTDAGLGLVVSKALDGLLVEITGCSAAADVCSRLESVGAVIECLDLPNGFRYSVKRDTGCLLGTLEVTHVGPQMKVNPQVLNRIAWDESEPG